MTCAIISKQPVNTSFFNEYEPTYIEIKEKIRQTIWDLVCVGYTDFYSNCEYGVSLWAAEIITALKMYNDIKLHIVMPYEEQATKWHEDHRDRFFTVHEKADTVKIISNHYTEDCYEMAEEYMRERADKCIYFDINEISK